MAEPELVEISLLSGRSPRPSITFTPGAPAPTVSIGSTAQWSVTADGVQPIHVFLAFDGQRVHVAAAHAEMPVLLAGSPVGKDWTAAPVPCELRFGGACLILRRIPRPGAIAQEEATMHDGGALLLAAQQRASLTPASTTQPLGRAVPNVPSMRPAAGMPPETARTGPPTMADAPRPGMPDLGRTVPLADPHGFHEAVLAASAAASGPAPDSAPTQVRAPAAAPPQPPPLDWEKTVVAPHPPGFDVPQARPEPVAPPQPVAPPAATVAPAAGTASPASSQLAQLRARLLDSWRAASHVKKATMLLLPFALLGALFLFHDEPPPPAKHARPSASAAARGGDVSDAAPAFLAARTTLDAGTTHAETAPGDTSSDSSPRTTPLPPGKRTPEREALDTTAAGAFDDAARRYDALAASHPDDPTYREAARILRAKAGSQ